MQILSTAIPDIVLLAPAVYRDDRGYFLESYNRRTKLTFRRTAPRFLGEAH